MKYLKVVLLTILVITLSGSCFADVETFNALEGWYGCQGGTLTRDGDFFKWQVESEELESYRVVFYNSLEDINKQSVFEKDISLDKDFDSEIPHSGILSIQIDNETGLFIILDNITIDEINIKVHYLNGGYLFTNEEIVEYDSVAIFQFSKNIDETLSEISSQFIFLFGNMEVKEDIE